MRLLFDENLSNRLPDLLGDCFPESVAAANVALGGQPDGEVWEHAKAGGFVLVTKDDDFQRLSVMQGSPPKVIWIRLGNCATADVARLLRFRVDQIRVFVEDNDSAFLALG